MAISKHFPRLFFSVGLLLLLAAPAARADSFTFATIPASGAISGFPGSTIGWGYTITNQSATDVLVFTGLSAGLFQNGTPLVLFDFPIVAPGATVSVPFDPLNGLGLYQLTWDPNAPIGFVNSGTFIVTGDFCTDIFCSNVVQGNQSQSASYAATVVPTPEPASLTLVAAGLAGVVSRFRRWRCAQT